MEPTQLDDWGRESLERLLSKVRDANAAFCNNPKSARRVHELRKALARLKCAVEDLVLLTRDAEGLYEETKQLHKRAGKVRDADVMLAKLARFDPQEVRELCSMLRARRKKANRKLRKAVAKSRF
jgi:CHAD domain-containing protein